MSAAVDKAPDCAGRNGAHTGDEPDTSTPWRVVSEPNGRGNRLPTWAVYGPYNCVIAVPGHRAHNFANAHLIAAAPDLLEALKACLEELRLIRMKDCGAVYDIMCRHDAEMAIAKAEGRANA